ncbi:MAG: cbb3-type cytochrome oxidase assembly protein CcoS [Burkholderiales bacterium]
MESLYLLLPMSLVVVGLTAGLLWWAVFSGQYDDPDEAAQSILTDDDSTVDASRAEDVARLPQRNKHRS